MYMLAGTQIYLVIMAELSTPLLGNIRLTLNATRSSIYNVFCLSGNAVRNEATSSLSGDSWDS